MLIRKTNKLVILSRQKLKITEKLFVMFFEIITKK